MNLFSFIWWLVHAGKRVFAVPSETFFSFGFLVKADPFLLKRSSRPFRYPPHARWNSGQRDAIASNLCPSAFKAQEWWCYNRQTISVLSGREGRWSVWGGRSGGKQNKQLGQQEAAAVVGVAPRHRREKRTLGHRGVAKCTSLDWSEGKSRRSV